MCIAKKRIARISARCVLQRRIASINFVSLLCWHSSSKDCFPFVSLLCSHSSYLLPFSYSLLCCPSSHFFALTSLLMGATLCYRQLRIFCWSHLQFISAILMCMVCIEFISAILMCMVCIVLYCTRVGRPKGLGKKGGIWKLVLSGIGNLNCK